MKSAQLYGAVAAGFIAGCLAVSGWNAAVPAATGASPTNVVASRHALTSLAAPHAEAPTRQAPSASACPSPAHAGPSETPLQNASAPAAERRLDSLLRQLRARADAPPDPLSEALNLLKTSARDRADLMARYSREQDESTRKQLRMLLMLLPNDDVISFAMNMAGDGNAATRTEGYILLRQSQAGSVPARELLLKAVGSEQDTHALAEAVASLMPGESPAPTEAAAVVEQLKRSVQHPSPEVRGESLLALTRWDRGGGTEELVFAGLTDPNAPVQQAALTAVFENRLRTDRVKTILMSLASDNANAVQTRVMAVEALGGFNLTSAEHSTVAKLREGITVPTTTDSRVD